MSAPLQIGTRGSELALRQARSVAAAIAPHTGAEPEIVVIQTQGDREADAPMLPGAWATGAFVSEIERALAAGRIDLAVHSHKDLATVSLPGLLVVATPARAAAHDVLVAATASIAEGLRAALAGAGSAADVVVGTSSPRRTAQLRRALSCRIEPLRGNVPTRVARAAPGDLDAVCLAAAGIERLELSWPHIVPLSLDRFPAAPAQGAIAIQARAGTASAQLGAMLDHEPTHRCVRAERAFLAGVGAGCHAPIAATASAGPDDAVELHVQLFDGEEFFDRRAAGDDPEAVGAALARQALEWMHDARLDHS